MFYFTIRAYIGALFEQHYCNDNKRTLTALMPHLIYEFYTIITQIRWFYWLYLINKHKNSLGSISPTGDRLVEFVIIHVLNSNKILIFSLSLAFIFPIIMDRFVCFNLFPALETLFCDLYHYLGMCHKSRFTMQSFMQNYKNIREKALKICNSFRILDQPFMGSKERLEFVVIFSLVQVFFTLSSLFLCK